ncbi:hypothetical protein Efla_001436 [Eimeria flavescens]
MSDIYANEPVTSGKVVLHTTMGPLDVELWSREAPRTCRSFVQLCLEGYYDKTIFHRLIPGFLVQGGDPTGTGEGGLSIYDDPQVLESHAGSSAAGLKALKPCEGPPLSLELNSRLRFRYRGLMGAASRVQDTEGEPSSAPPPSSKARAGGGAPPQPTHIGSQFFFTLGSAEALSGRHTLFGKVTGPSLFNLLRIGELPIDKCDRPLDPPVIIRTEVLWNPFNDIVPRCLPPPEEQQQVEEEEEEELQQRPQLAAAKANLLLAAAAAAAAAAQQQQEAANRLKARIASLAATRGSAAAPAAAAAELLDDGSSSCSSSDSTSDEEDKRGPRRSRSRSRSRGREEQRIPPKRGAPQALGRKDFAAAVAAQPDADLLSAAEQRRRLLLLQRKTKSSRDRQQQTLAKLSAFKQQLQALQKSSSSSSSSKLRQEEEASKSGKRDKAAEAARVAAARATERVLPALPEGDADSEEEGGPEGAPWFQTGGLRFAIDSSTAYQIDAARAAELEVRDPLKNRSVTTDPKLQMRKMPTAHEGKPRELARW